MSLLHIVTLAIVQGLAELLPVSSSAHVVVAEKLLGLDPSSPPMTLLLVMLHTGTMFAVIVYFWRTWRGTYFQSLPAFKRFATQVIIATLLTGIIGEGLKLLIERIAFAGLPKAQIEDLFGHLELIAPALGAAGVLILVAGLATRGRARGSGADDLTPGQSSVIGAVQGLCLPFRGFSRSGATISTGMLLGVTRSRVEAFSFALAVVLTPAVDLREALRLMHSDAAPGALRSTALLSMFGAFIAFLAGLAALRWLSRWLETDRWYLFGIYCLIAAAAVEYLHSIGY
jgi:undecaprenyl-diphosphatase